MSFVCRSSLDLAILLKKVRQFTPSAAVQRIQNGNGVKSIASFQFRQIIRIAPVARSEREDDDMPLHLSIRFDEGIFTGRIVFNTFTNGNWSETENRISSPFVPGEDFDIRVRIRGGKYQVFGNRREIGLFEQRVPLEGVTHVSITGDADNLRVFHYGGTIFANPYTAIAKLMPGMRLDISALPNGKRININLYRKNGEYALHLSLRFNEGAIVRNTINGDVWHMEEREGGFPLSMNELFDLTIVNEPLSFRIFVNMKYFCDFVHRGSPSDIDTLEIDGTVDLHTVIINNVNDA